MNRRDLLLHEMNIPQWVLRKPQALKGDAQIRLDEKVKLVVVCEEAHQHSRLFGDILQAMNLNRDAYQWLNPEQSQRLTFTHSPLFWFIGHCQQADHFAQKEGNRTAWQSKNWQVLSKSQYKRQLWQQIQTFLQEA